jgi:hypothetical protein
VLWLSTSLCADARDPVWTNVTVKPDGGGDFSVAQAAEDWVGSQSNKSIDVWLYFSGGTNNLGPCLFQSWSPEATTNNYAKFLTAPDQRHDGTTNAVGAWVDVGSYGWNNIGVAAVRNLWLEGVRFVHDEPVVPYTIDVASQNTTIRDCLGICTTQGYLGSPLMFIHAKGCQDSYFYNNIAYGNETNYTYGIWLGYSVLFVTTTNDVANNTIYGVASNGFVFGHGIEASTQPAFVNVRNNVSIDSGLDDYLVNYFVTNYTVYMTNNVSSDTTSTNWGGSGNITGVTAAAAFVSTSDVTPLRDGPLCDGAVPLWYVDTDARGWRRPINGGPDTGAREGWYARGFQYADLDWIFFPGCYCSECCVWAWYDPDATHMVIK